MRITKNKTVVASLFILVLCMIFINQSCNQNTQDKPSAALLNKYSQFTEYTDPGEYSLLYNSMPETTEGICKLVKKQLIHPFEAREMKDIIPEDRYMEDGDFPTVSDMLKELLQRDSEGLIMTRKPANRLVVACYHHSLLFASMLRSKGIPVRMRAGFARYFEKQANVRFGHIICEVWDNDKQAWIIVDPDRNYINLPASRFEFPSVSWENYKNDRIPDVTYTSSTGNGAQAILHILLLDQAFVLSDERNYWHTPVFLFTDSFSPGDFNKNKIEIIDKIAMLMNKPDNNIDKLQQIYLSNEFLNAQERSLETYYQKMYGEDK